MSFCFIFDMLQRSKEGRSENALRRERRKERNEKLYGQMKRSDSRMSPEQIQKIMEQGRQKEKEETRYMAWGYLLLLLFCIAIAAWLVNRYVI